MKLLLVLVVILSGCGFSYSFNPGGNISKAELAKALQERDGYIKAMATEIKALKEKNDGKSKSKAS